MKNIILTLALLVSVSTVSAQNWGSKKTKGNGSIVTENRSGDQFNKLKVSGDFRVVLTSDRTKELSIKTDENLMYYIITEVKDGSLLIKMKKNYHLKPSNHKAIAVQVPLNFLREIALSGSGSIRSEEQIKTDQLIMKMSGSGKIIVGLTADDIEAVLSGSGRIELYGSSSNFEAALSSSGSVKAKELKTEEGEFTVSGSGRIETNVTEKIIAKISGSGSIRYIGSPNLSRKTKVSGSGSIREIKDN